MSKIPFIETYLDNGIKVIMSRNRRIPISIILVGFRVGSKMEQKGKKGIAHLLEHLMFTNIEGEDRNHFDKMITLNGGDTNAVTSYDYTYYYIQIPSSKLEFAVALDANRFNNISLDEESLKIQKKVVIEEKLEAYDNAPYGDVDLLCSQNLFSGTDYETPIIGLEKDINSINILDVKEFFYKNYIVNNCIITVAGNIDYDKVYKILNKYYRTIHTNDCTNYEFKDRNFEHSFELYPKSKVDLELNGKFIFFKTTPRNSSDYYALKMISIILGDGFSSRLYRNLIYEKEIAQLVYVSNSSYQHAGVFEINVFFNDNKKEKEIEKNIFDEINSLRYGDFADEEFEKARNKIQLAYANGYQKNLSLAQSLFYYEFYHNNVRLINEDIKNYLRVTKNDIKKTVERYLNFDKRLIITYMKK